MVITCALNFDCKPRNQVLISVLTSVSSHVCLVDWYRRCSPPLDAPLRVVQLEGELPPVLPLQPGDPQPGGVAVTRAVHPLGPGRKPTLHNHLHCLIPDLAGAKKSSFRIICKTKEELPFCPTVLKFKSATCVRPASIVRLARPASLTSQLTVAGGKAQKKTRISTVSRAAALILPSWVQQITRQLLQFVN